MCYLPLYLQPRETSMSFKTMDDGQVLLYAVSVELQWLTIIYNAKKKKKEKKNIDFKQGFGVEGEWYVYESWPRVKFLLYCIYICPCVTIYLKLCSIHYVTLPKLLKINKKSLCNIISHLNKIWSGSSLWIGHDHDKFYNGLFFLIFILLLHFLAIALLICKNKINKFL